MIVIVNSSIHDGTYSTAASEILKNLAAEDGSDSQSDAVEDNWWTIILPI